MSIPIRNLYYMFLYAWAQFPAGAIGEVGIDRSPDLPNLFAKLLLANTKRLLRHGLDRDYQTFTDELVGPRGRLRLDRIIKDMTQLRGTAICDFDELTHNILPNQIIKATIVDLAACAEVEKETRHELRLLARRLYEVADIRLSSNQFYRVLVSRSNREYVFLMRLCEFVFRLRMPTEHGVGARFKSILEDELRMSALFEDFLRNFFQLHRKEYSVGAEFPQWYVSDATEYELSLLPRMETDITLRQPHTTMIIDAKFYAKGAFVEGRYGERKLRSGHLYQLITYLQHEHVRHPARQIAGMLLYAAVNESVCLKYELLGIPILVASVDLAQEWPDIEAELHNLLDRCGTAARVRDERGVGSAHPLSAQVALSA